MMAMSFLNVGHAGDGQADKNGELAKLKAQLEEQQKQIEQLSKMLVEQKKLIEQVSSSNSAAPASVNAVAAAAEPTPTPAPPVHMLPNMGEVASATPMLPPPPPAPAPHVLDAQVPAGEPSSPLQFRIGDTSVTPLGFMDMMGVWKSENAGSSIGTNFGSIPFNNTTTGTSRLSEFRFSPQNSRIGFRFDADVKDAHVIAYNEDDFLGTSGTNNLSVTNGAFVPRLRLFWVDIRKGAWEILGGQSWSLLTPGRVGISPLPGDIYFTEARDVNYMVGIPWSRQPGFRFGYHPTEKVAFAVALENPDAYIGGSGGGGTSVLPTALSGLAGVQFDNASSVQTTPNLHPDIIAKLAFDPAKQVHFEFAGIERTFKDWVPATNVYFTKVAAGGSFNANFELVKGFRIFTNNFWSDGGGRYLFGEAPDLILRSNGSISPIHAGGMLQGFEATIGNTLFYADWGGIYAGRDVALDANGTALIGYGYHGSANSQNRDIQELTFGFNQTIWKNPKWGALVFMGQYEYIFREPWYLATNAPKQAHLDSIFINLRYALPGIAPAMHR
jgi:uncharacterized coiled-coil protein SlyX